MPWLPLVPLRTRHSRTSVRSSSRRRQWYGPVRRPPADRLQRRGSPESRPPSISKSYCPPSGNFNALSGSVLPRRRLASPHLGGQRAEVAAM